jgi:thioredoxin reductase
MQDAIALEADVLTVGGGRVGTFAALKAERHGAWTKLLDTTVVRPNCTIIKGQNSAESTQ